MIQASFDFDPQGAPPLADSPPPDLREIGLATEGNAEAFAAFTPDRRYRHLLGRAWRRPRRVMVWCCLNPSTADALKDDPSVRRMIGFAKREDCDGILLVNLFGWCTPYAKELPAVIDPVGAQNERTIRWAFELPNAALRVAAWGRIGTKTLRALAAPARAYVMGLSPMCFGWTEAEPIEPRHPLMLRADSALVRT